MIRLKVFVSSVQKELRQERLAVGSLLATDEFLRQCLVARIFEDYPAPLTPNPRQYLELLGHCHIYLLLIGKEYGNVSDQSLSATHEEYRLAQELKLPTLVCAKSLPSRDPRAEELWAEVLSHHHTYSRFSDLHDLRVAVRERLKQHILDRYEVAPTAEQEHVAIEGLQSASYQELALLDRLDTSHLDHALARELAATAEDVDRDGLPDERLWSLLHARSYLWWDAGRGAPRPTVAGALLLASNPSLQLPQSKVQLDAYQSEDRAEEPLDSTLLEQPLPHAIQQAVAFVRRNVPQPLEIRGLQRVSTGPYPLEVVREAIVNAVAHRDYSERGAKVTIEVFPSLLRITSPGLPPGGDSPETLASGNARSAARNPLVVQGLSWLGYMEERGTGIRRMRRLMAENGNPPPRFRFERGAVVLELLAGSPSRATSPQGDAEALDPPATREEAILRLARHVGFVTTQTCVDHLEVSRDTAWRLLAEMTRAGLLLKTGAGRGIRYIPAAGETP